MKEMTWKSRLNRLFAHRFALPVLCWCAALVFWLVQGAVCGGQLRQGKRHPD